MTNKDVLEQYTAVLAECRSLEKELFGLRDKGIEYVTDAVSGCPDYPPYGVRSVKIAGMTQDPEVKREIKSLEANIEQQYKNALFWRNKAEDILSRIPRAKDRMIVRLYCIDNLDWKNVAIKMGNGHTENSVKKQYSRIVKNI